MMLLGAGLECSRQPREKKGLMRRSLVAIIVAVLLPACSGGHQVANQPEAGADRPTVGDAPLPDVLSDAFLANTRTPAMDGAVPGDVNAVHDAAAPSDQAGPVADVAGSADGEDFDATDASQDRSGRMDSGIGPIDGPRRDAASDVPPDTAAAFAIVSFTCNPTTIRPGASTTLRWEVRGSDTVSIDNDIGTVPSISLLTMVPTQTTTYTLTTVSSSGEVLTRTATVTVVPSAVITKFTADNATVTSGQSTMLRGEFSGGTGTLEQQTVTSPFEQSTGTLTASRSFVLYVADALATTTARVNIRVVAPPTITQFSAASTTVKTGTAPVVTAVFKDGTGVIDQGVGSVSSNVATTAPVQAEALTYTLTVTNAAGDSVTAKVAVGVSDTGFELTGSMTNARLDHTATLLGNGKVLIAGSYHNLSGYLSSATLYDPTTGTFSSTGGMSAARGYHTATMLQDGRVLVTGGHDYSATHASADIYDPATGRFAATGTMTTPRKYHCAAPLADGKVLIVGGNDDVNTLATAELFDPTTGRFTAIGAMAEQRQSFNVVTLASGKVLVVSGNRWVGSGSFPASTTAELYDPTTGTFSLAGNLSMARDYATVTLLTDGRVLIAGGYNDPASISAEIYDPKLGTFSSTGALSGTRAVGHTATLLPSGKVLVVGGCSKLWKFPLFGELYDPATGLFSGTGPMSVPREHHTATLLSDGSVLVAGGEFEDPYNIVTVTYASAEIYR